MLSKRIDDPAPGQQSLGIWMFRWAVTLLVRRLILQEVRLPWLTLAGDEVVIDTAFIRAPIVTGTGEGVQVTARHEGEDCGCAFGQPDWYFFPPGGYGRYDGA